MRLAPRDSTPWGFLLSRKCKVIVTNYPRTSEMTDEQWKLFRSYNHKRRDKNKPEVDFETWLKGNEEKWPGVHKQDSKKPENVSSDDWANYIAVCSYRRLNGMKQVSIKEYLAKVKRKKSAKKVARIVAKINAKIGVRK